MDSGSLELAARIALRATLVTALVVSHAVTIAVPAVAAMPSEPSSLHAKKGDPGGPGKASPTPTPESSGTTGRGNGNGNKATATPAPTPAPTAAPTPEPTPTATPAPTSTPAPEATAAVSTTGACKITSVVIDANSRQALLRPGERTEYVVRWQTGGKCAGATVGWTTDQPGGTFSGSSQRDATATATFTAGPALGANWRITASVSTRPGSDSKSDSRFVDVKLDATLAASAASGRAGTTATVRATLTSAGTPLAARAIAFAGAGATATGVTDATGTAEATLSLASASAGTYTYTATFSGDAQYRPAGTSASLVVAPADVTPPLVTPSIAGPKGGSDWFVGDVLVTWTVSDPESAVTSLTGCAPQTVTTDGTGQRLDCTATSAGGTTTVSASISRDAAAPTIQAGRTSATAGWSDGDVTVTFTCADATSGVASCAPPVVVDGEGAELSATGQAVDRAGNVATLTVTGIRIDRAPPKISATRTAPNGAGWNSASVTVTFICADALSGIAECTAPFTLGSEGAGQSASGRALDAVGHEATTTVDGINIDLTAPAVSISRTAANASGWNNSAVTVTFTCADVLSGVETCPAAMTLAAEGPAQSASGTATDRAGNASTATARDVNIDLTRPTITSTRTPANPNGWNNDDVVVTFECADGLSGIATCGAPAVFFGEGADLRAASRDAVDRAGNVAQLDVSGIKIDRTKPVITFAGNAGSYTVDGTVAITCIANDPLSGIAATTCPQVASAPAYSFVAAATTVVTRTASASDLADNASSAGTSFTVVVGYDGVCTLTKRFSTDADLGTSLCAQLGAAALQDARGNEAAKWNAIAAYQREVQAQSGRAFTTDLATLLVSLSNLL